MLQNEVLLKVSAYKDALTKADWTPLLVAAVNGKIEAIKMLCAAGARKDARTRDGKTPLQLAHLWANCSGNSVAYITKP